MTIKSLLFVLCGLCSTMLSRANGDVSIALSGDNRAATLRNGIVSIYIGKTGKVESCLLKGTTEAQDVQLIDTKQKQSFYFSCNQPDYSELEASETQVVENTTDMAHVTFSQTSATGIKWTQRYILRRGDSGYYSYLVAEGVGDNSLGEARIVYRLDDAKFRYGYVNSRMQGTLPDAAEMKRSEAREVQDATFTLDDGTIYTKYDWACYVKDDHFHGLIDEADGVGAWTIPVSTEYINGGPMRQDLTVHASDKSPLILQMLHGNHFGPQAQVYATGTKKIYGPFFFYINKGTRSDVIDDAAAKATELESQWPFTWFSHELYPTERTTVSGCLKVGNGYDASPVRVVLSKTAEPYDDGDDYIYWAETESDGTFTIRNVRPGTYTLTAYALNGKNTSQLTREGVVVSGATTDLGNVMWRPERFGTEVFRIGESNRLSDGYKLSDADRSYSLYQESPADLTFSVGSSNEAEDWYYAQTKVGTWTIKFDIDDPNHPFRLTASAAGAANVTRINVYVNGTEMANNTWTYQSDGSVYRSAVQSGRYQQHTLDLPAGVLKAGENTIALELSDHNYATSGIAGIMWDCIKLEMDEDAETYDFTTLEGNPINQDSEHYAAGTTLYLLAFADNDFNNRFAIGPKERTGTGGFYFRNADATYKGLYSQWDNRNFSILNLVKGNRVTLTLSNNVETLKFVGGDAVISGKTYTVEADGNLDFVTTGGVYIEKVVIEEPVSSVPVTVGVAGYSNEYNFKELGEETADISATSPLTSAGGETFGNRFEFASGVKTTDVKFTKNFGLKILWAHKLFYIKDLKVGEKVTINFTTTAINISGTSILNDVADNGVITSGTTYTVKTAGDLILDNQDKNTTIEDITISMIEQNIGGATLVSENALDFTDVTEIEAYVATAASAGTVTFNRVYKVAAETPLYLKANAAVSVDVPVLDGDPETISTNLLKGSATNTTDLRSTDDTKYYVFGVLDDEAGFYPVSTTGTLTSAAGKAYLELTVSQASSARSIRMVFDDVTGINTVKENEGNETGDNIWYTLQGARVAKPTHGIYIRNGKKIFIK